ncbi:MAG TPA: hypothetical protein DCZ95_16940 [Verrucomicrobia bacterium]|nr:MAG: hypothetical protein A2X46_09430 [Lentisphaerae bacterium GWF2_57_35]HBA85771.1 hypothetical protein [Verrucomicrobiota bacterium]
MKVTIRVGLVFVSVLSAMAAWATSKVQEPAVDLEQYNALMASRVSDAADLDLWFKACQFDWLPLALPDETGESVLRQPTGRVLPFNPRQFSSDFTKKLIVRYLNAVPSYRLWLVEDRTSRSTLFYNEKGELVLSLPPEPGYDPRWFLKETHPDLFSGRYTPSYINWMTRFYDPARVALEVTLIPEIYAEDFLYVESRLAEKVEMQALASGLSGGMVLMSYQGPPVSNFCFTAIEKTTNFIRLTIAYPYNAATYPTNCYTNRLDVFHSADLMEFWWDLAATTNVSASTNWIEWTDHDVTNVWATPRLYALGSPFDSDGDGFSDSREIMMYHSDPNNAASHPVSVSGVISYSGAETGTIFALASVYEDGWSIGCSASLSSPGPYTNNAVAIPRSYWFRSFLDINNNHSRDAWEPWGLYSSSSTYVTSNLGGINMTLQDVPSLWGTISYSGTATGDVYVVAAPTSNSFDKTYSFSIPWIQGSPSDTGGVTYLSFPVNYAILGLPASNYYVRAFIDQDYDGEHTFFEVAGQHSNAVAVSHRVTGVNITLALDTDSDGLPDWWELSYGLDPGDDGSGNIRNGPNGDPDSDGANNLTEYLQGRNPIVGASQDSENAIGLTILSPLER